VLLARIAALLVAIAIAVALLLWTFTRNRAYLTFAARLFKWAVLVGLGFGGLLVLERVIVLL
jgi:hypothetical protein